MLPAVGLLASNNVFTYRQNVTAGYAAYTLGLPKGFTLKPGVRYEYTTIQASFAKSEAASIPDYGVLVPSVNLSRKLSNGNVVKLAYNSRIQRPSLQFLNPNVNAQNPKNISFGNPRLPPNTPTTTSWATARSTRRLNLNFSTFVRNTTGSIEALRTVRGIDTVSTTYANIGQQNAYGGSVFANINSGKLSLNVRQRLLLHHAHQQRARPKLCKASNEGFVMSGRV